MKFRPTYANVVSTLALLIALSGGAYAATGGSLILGRGNSASSLTGVNGIVILVYGSKSGSGTVSVAGGSPAAGAGSGGTGEAGSSGTIYELAA
jgi:hypothetical protein